MIKALSIVQLWSVIVAGGAWLLQRDGAGRVGASFPASNVWLSLIVLSMLPGVLHLVPFSATISFPKIEALEFFPIQASSRSAEASGILNYIAVYLGLSFLLMSRTLWRWSRLQGLPLVPTTEPGVFTTTAVVPPLTLSWPRRAVVIPVGFEAQAALIRHERAHLHHYDAELTLLLLLLQDLMLRGPGVSFLVRQWRLSIELRADHAATKMLSRSERKDYAALLLNILHPSGGGQKALPCPTAQLGSTRHRNAKMRLGEIINTKPKERKPHWGLALLFTSIGASGIGLMSAAAFENVVVVNAEPDQVDYVLVDYVMQTSLQIPTKCPRLKMEDTKYEEKQQTLKGRLVSQHTVTLGTVVLSHDVRTDGSIHNPRVLGSTHPCFEDEAKTAIVQWMAEPQESELKNVALKLHFAISAATVDDLKLQLNDLLE